MQKMAARITIDEATATRKHRRNTVEKEFID